MIATGLAAPRIPMVTTFHFGQLFWYKQDADAENAAPSSSPGSRPSALV
jgi:hypothetical protein